MKSRTFCDGDELRGADDRHDDETHAHSRAVSSSTNFKCRLLHVSSVSQTILNKDLNGLFWSGFPPTHVADLTSSSKRLVQLLSPIEEAARVLWAESRQSTTHCRRGYWRQLTIVSYDALTMHLDGREQTTLASRAAVATWPHEMSVDADRLWPHICVVVPCQCREHNRPSSKINQWQARVEWSVLIGRSVEGVSVH